MNVNSHGKSLQRCYCWKTDRVAQLEKEFAKHRNDAGQGLAGARDAGQGLAGARDEFKSSKK